VSPTWRSDDPPVLAPLTGREKLRAAARGGVMVGALLLGLVVLIPLRLVERPVHGIARPWTGHVPSLVSRAACWAMGFAYVRRGEPMRHRGAVVANHSSWLDIFVLNAGGPLTFVSKSEVAAWPVIGWVARAAGTVFVRRDAREARAQTEMFRERFAAGDKLLFFPEGTSTDGQRILPFKPTLFAAVHADGLKDRLWVQPVTVAYFAPEGAEPRFYGWWGDMDFGPHLLRVLARSPQGRVEVTWHPPLRVADLADRKALARTAEAAVRSAHPAGGAET
jgi:1-acyl-sn-glycerol-3-phosphate acyltransferase